MIWVRCAGGPDIVDLSGSGNLQTGVVYSGSSTLPAGTWTIRLRARPAGVTQTCQLNVTVSVTVPPTPTPTPIPTPTPTPTADAQTDAKANGQTDPRPGGDAKTHPEAHPETRRQTHCQAGGQANGQATGETGLEADGRPDRQACDQAHRRSDADRVVVAEPGCWDRRPRRVRWPRSR